MYPSRSKLGTGKNLCTQVARSWVQEKNLCTQVTQTRVQKYINRVLTPKKRPPPVCPSSNSGHKRKQGSLLLFILENVWQRRLHPDAKPCLPCKRLLRERPCRLGQLSRRALLSGWRPCLTGQSSCRAPFPRHYH